MGHKTESKIDDKRREFVVDMLTAGVFASGLIATTPVYANLFGKTPRKMQAGQSIFNMQGNVFVNNEPATLETLIKPKDTVKTGKNGKIIFVVGKDAFTLHGNSELTLSGTDLLLNGFRLLTGRLLSVFGNRKRSEPTLIANTNTATIGIRGTGVYFESEADLSYVCTCYGKIILKSTANPERKETILTTHHDSPRYIHNGSKKGPVIQPAPMKNHTDLELMLIEELMGRVPPFGVAGDGYVAPKRRY